MVTKAIKVKTVKAKRSRKATASRPVPQTREAAIELVGELARVQREAEGIIQAQAAAIERIKTEAASAVEPLIVHANDMAAALLAYAETNRDELFSKVRTAALGPAKLSLRWSNPAVQLARGIKEDQMVVTLKKLGLGKFVRVEESLNRQAIIDDPGLVEPIAGIDVVQVERLRVKLDGVEKPIEAEFARVTGQAARHKAEE